MSLLCSPNYFFYWEEITFFFPEISAECTKATLLYADICEIDVSVYNIRDNISYSSFSKFVSYGANKFKFNSFCGK